jgi:hypothetical protein
LTRESTDSGTRPEKLFGFVVSDAGRAISGFREKRSEGRGEEGEERREWKEKKMQNRK